MVSGRSEPCSTDYWPLELAAEARALEQEQAPCSVVLAVVAVLAGPPRLGKRSLAGSLPQVGQVVLAV